MLTYVTLQDRVWRDPDNGDPYTLPTVDCIKRVTDALPDEAGTTLWPAGVSIPSLDQFVIDGVYYSSVEEAKQAGALP